MSLKIEKRQELDLRMFYMTPVLAVCLTVLTGFFLFMFMGYDPFSGIYYFFISPLLSSLTLWSRSPLADAMVP